jgi:hypothetical protein
MAAPTFVQASAGGTDASGAWTTGSTLFPGNFTLGNVMIFQVVQDGTAASPTVDTVQFKLEDLTGTDSALTSIGEFNIGSPTSASQHLWIGRVAAGASNFATITGSNAGGDDLYWRYYEFTNVNTGTLLSQVIENGSAGSTSNGTPGTSTTIADTGVTTLGPDRLALNFIGVNDDPAIDAFAGETGGDWVEAVAEYAEASGTDGALSLQTAAMPTAGTIDGGSDGIAASFGWGVVGFALIGTTVASTPGPVWRRRPASRFLTAR